MFVAVGPATITQDPTEFKRKLQELTVDVSLFFFFILKAEDIL